MAKLIPPGGSNVAQVALFAVGVMPHAANGVLMPLSWRQIPRTGALHEVSQEKSEPAQSRFPRIGVPSNGI
ncbi:hypothetical protein [Massilia glaciei]|uniref:hypothetical protein n=1 Tax=Massilia glaciei TaxID=1524097 RepID=UPI0011B1EC85|nr:hypothetical protein [Massilia glaciei]